MSRTVENKRLFSSSHPMLCLVNPPPPLWHHPVWEWDVWLAFRHYNIPLISPPVQTLRKTSIENSFSVWIYMTCLHGVMHGALYLEHAVISSVQQLPSWPLLFCSLYCHCWADLPSLLSTIKTHPVSKSKPLILKKQDIRANFLHCWYDSSCIFLEVKTTR